MNILDTIKANPQGVTKAAFALAFAAVSLWFLLTGNPDKANTVNESLAAFVVPVSTALTFALAFISSVHFMRGPVPTAAAPVVVETVGQAKSDGIMPKA